MAIIAMGTLTVADESLPMEGLAEASTAALIPGTSVERYGRVWHLGQIAREGDVLTGRAGYDARDTRTHVWDPKRNDFVVVRPLLGQTSQFALDLASMRIAFQLRSGTIRVQTFRGALQGLMRKNSRYRWIVEFAGTTQPSWEDWLNSVERVTHLNFTLTRPNPRFRRQVIQDVFEDTKVEAFQWGFTAPKDGTLDVQGSELITASIDHATHYGGYTAAGVEVADGREEKTEWKSDIEREVLTTQIPLDQNSGEVETSDLRTTLASDPTREDSPRSGGSSARK
jgi:hypothetical protein